MTIISFPKRLGIIDAAARDPDVPACFYERKPFEGLPFVSKELSEYGWPVNPWQVTSYGVPLDDRRTGEEYGRLAYDHVVAYMDKHRFRTTLAALSLERTLEAIVLSQAARRAKGGKGSRSLDSIESGFISGLCRRVAGIRD